MSRHATILVLLLCAVQAAHAQPEPTLFSASTKLVKPVVVLDRQGIQPDNSEETAEARIGVLLKIEEGWHIYWQNSGEAGIPTTVSWRLPPGWRAGQLQWPLPQKIVERGNIVTYGYSTQVLLYADLFAPPIDPGKSAPITLSAGVRWLACRDVCVPGQAEAAAKVQFSEDAAQQTSPHYALFEQYELLIPLSAGEAAAAVPELTLQPILQTNAAAAGSTVEGIIVLQTGGKQSSRSTPPQMLLQLFPLPNDYVSFAEPMLSAGSASPGQPQTIKFALNISAGAPLGPMNAAGVLALSPEITGRSTPTALNWEVPLTVTSAPTERRENPEFLQIVQQRVFDRPLEYALIKQADEPESRPRADSVPRGAAQSRILLLAALAAGFLGGILLNLMPCVLPIIAIKVMGFVHAANRSHRSSVTAALFFGLGVISSFIVLALAILVLRSLGHQLGWGFQFQHPGYVFTLALIVFLLSLGFFDMYALRLPGSKQADKALSGMHSGLLRDFFDGVLTTALSTPCTAPFLGTALVAAFAAPPAATIVIFLSIGLGLAAPYMVLAASPRLASYLPAPGPWMTRLRASMGFLLLLTVLWLLTILDRLSENGIIWALACMLAVFAMLQICRWAKESGSVVRTRLAAAAAVLVGILFAAFAYGKMIRQPQGPDDQHLAGAAITWEPYSPQLLHTAEQQGIPLFLVFTADWCLTCKANELLVIEKQAIAGALQQHSIVPVKADWTTGDEQITRALKEFGAEGVPLYVVIPADPTRMPLVLPTLLTREILLDAFRQASRQPA